MTRLRVTPGGVLSVLAVATGFLLVCRLLWIAVSGAPLTEEGTPLTIFGWVAVYLFAFAAAVPAARWLGDLDCWLEARRQRRDS